MDEESISESGGLAGNWNGPRLASEAEVDEIDFDKIVDVDADDEDDEDSDSEEFDVQLSPSDERLLEELLRLKLTSLPGTTGSSQGGLAGLPGGGDSSNSAVTSASASSLLPLSKNRGLFQPRSKLEQFEDIIFESQLLEAALPELEVAAAAAVASNASFESVGFDFEASDAIFADDEPSTANAGDNDNDDGEENADEDNDCDCSTCRERMRHKEELNRLKQTWSELRDSVLQVYQDSMADSKDSLDKPDVTCLKGKVRQLLWRDPHQLYQRLEAIVKDCVLEQKVKLIKLLKTQAKNPSLAQDFIQRLLDGYERLCTACQYLAPVLAELEHEHLCRFSLTWEVLNKYLHQSIIYSDPIIQANVPIFISQLRSLYSDKEHEGKYTELVRGFLDFDVEMSNIVPLWTNSEKLLTEYNKQQAQLRAKQKMLKEDWERFKAQRRDLDIKVQMDSNKCATTSSSSLVEGIKNCPNFGAICDCDYCLSTAMEQQPSKSGDGGGEHCTATSVSVTVNGTGSLTGITASTASATKLSDVFPSLLTAEDRKPSPPPPEHHHLQQQLAQAQDLVRDLEEHMTISGNDPSEKPLKTKDVVTDGTAAAAGGAETRGTTPNVDRPKEQSPESTSTPPPVSSKSHTAAAAACAAVAAAPPVPSKNATTAKELRDLMYKHYCVGKGKLKKPSANAIKKGKVPPPTCSNPNNQKSNSAPPAPPVQHCSKGPESDTDELSEEEDDGSDDTSSETSKATTTTASESHNKNGAHCNCCYCEVFGPGGQSVAPVSRNYPEMRERLRLLLSKKKRKNQQKPPPPPPKKHAEQQQQQQQQHQHQHGQHQHGQHQHGHQHGQHQHGQHQHGQHQHGQSAGGCCSHTGQRASSASSSASSNVRSRQSESRSMSTESPAMVVPPGTDPNADETEVKDDKALDELLDFIEGNQKSSNEKKRAKKERQKMQKISEIKKKEDEERRIREAEEAERKRYEEETRKANELQRQLEKKRKKKESQRLKKLAAKGELPPKEEEDDEEDSRTSPDKKANPEIALEELRAKHMRELQELQLHHQRQLEEEARKLKCGQTGSSQQTAVPVVRSTSASSTASNQKNSSNRGSVTITKSKSNSNNSSVGATSKDETPINRMEALNAKPGTQIKITRTPTGSVEFTTVPAAGGGGISNTAVPGGMSASSDVTITRAPHAHGGAPGGGHAQSSLRNGSAPQAQPASLGQRIFDRPDKDKEPPPSSARPSVPSKTGAPMVTIRRVETPGRPEPMVTISMAKNENSGNGKNPGKDNGSDKLLYTLVNGQAMRTSEAPSDLLPDAQLMDNLSKKQKKKLKKQAQGRPDMGGLSGVTITQSNVGAGGGNPNPFNIPPPTGMPSHVPMGVSTGPPMFQPSMQQQQQPRAPNRPPLPLDPNGKIDLERLELPTGISITRIQGTNGGSDRKYFPANAAEYAAGGRDQSVLALPGTVPVTTAPPPNQHQHHPPQPSVSVTNTETAPSIGYSAIEGMPAGLNGPNVIVVDTSSLKTREEEEKEKKGKKKKKNKNKVDSDPLAKSASVGVMPSYMSPVIPRSATTTSVAAPSSTSGGSSHTGTGNTSSNSTSSNNAAANSLKSGPQVLIKNINGKVTITPVPGTGTGNAAEMVQQQQTPVVEPIPHKNSSSKQAQQQQKVQTPQSNSSLLQNSSQQQQQSHVNGVKKSPAPQMRQILDNNATISSSNVQKSHSVPNVNGHMQNQQHNQGRQQNSNKNNGNACPDHNEINEGTKKFSFNSADGDDPDKVFAPSNDIDLEKADDSDRVVEQFKRFLAGPSPSPDQPRVRPKVELDMKNIFKKKAPTVFNSHGNLSSAVAEQATPSTTTS